MSPTEQILDVYQSYMHSTLYDPLPPSYDQFAAAIIRVLRIHKADVFPDLYFDQTVPVTDIEAWYAREFVRFYELAFGEKGAIGDEQYDPDDVYDWAVQQLQKGIDSYLTYYGARPDEQMFMRVNLLLRDELVYAGQDVLSKMDVLLDREYEAKMWV